MGKMIMVTIQHGFVQSALQRTSPHCDDRPSPQDISLLVIHGISLPAGEFGGPYIDQLFMGTLDPKAHPSFASLRGLKVSAHLLIRREGAIIQYVSFDKRSWHAGVSTFIGRAHCNDFSIGIELEGTDLIPYTDAQYKSLIEVTRALQAHYPAITHDRITGHDTIAPERKTDPGPAFDWPRFLEGLR